MTGRVAGQPEQAGLSDPRTRGTAGGAPESPPRQRRPISPRSPLQGRQLWRIGDWGGASEAIGHRWETLGAVALRQQVLGHERPGPDGTLYVPRAAVILAEDRALADAVHRHGKSHADALLVGLADGEAVLEPVDFKWTLETAQPRQVGIEVLEALLDEAPPLLRQALDRALVEVGSPADGSPRLHSGIFLAPDHQENQQQIAPLGPLPAELVALCQVDPHEFFSSLPGWEMAVALSHVDGAYLNRLESAERYYRLGAGTLGALRKQRAGLFGEELPELDGPAELATLRRSRGLRQVGDLIAYLDRMLIARAELVEKLREVEKLGYPYARYRSDLAKRGLGQDPDERRRWDRLYAEIMKAVGRAVRAEGRALVVRGMGELDALEELRGRAAEFTRAARSTLEARLGQ